MLVIHSPTSGLLIPYSKPKAKLTLSRKETVKGKIEHYRYNQGSTIETEFINDPIEGIKIQHQPQYLPFLGHLQWILVDPRGFTVSICGYEVGKILKEFNTINGVIQDKCFYALGHKYTDIRLVKI